MSIDPPDTAAGRFTAKAYNPVGAACVVGAPVIIQPHPTMPDFTIFRAVGKGSVELEYSSLLPSGKPTTHRYIHLASGEQRVVMNVGIDECVTAYGKWANGPAVSAGTHYDIFHDAGKGVWECRNKTPHYIALHVELYNLPPVAGVAKPKTNYPDGTMDRTIAPKDTVHIFPGDNTILVKVTNGFEDVYPFSRP